MVDIFERGSSGLAHLVAETYSYCEECNAHYSETVNENHEDIHGLTESEIKIYQKGYGAGFDYGEHVAKRDSGIYKQGKRTRPRVLESRTTKLDTELGNLYITVCHDEDGHPFEVFGSLGKAGSTQHGMTELACRLIALHLRRGTPVEEIVHQCQGIHEMQPWANDMGNGETIMVHGLGDGIAHILRQYLKEPEPEYLVEAYREYADQRASFSCDLCGNTTRPLAMSSSGETLCDACEEPDAPAPAAFGSTLVRPETQDWMLTEKVRVGGQIYGAECGCNFVRGEGSRRYWERCEYHEDTGHEASE